MKQLQFLGAAGDVTGSAYLLSGEDKTKLLVDFGMFQGDRNSVDLNYKTLAFKPSELSGVFLTHAHLDHCGRLPLLVFGGYFGKIYMTAATRALVEVILTDSARIAKEDLQRLPLYGADEVDKVLKMIVDVDYNQKIQIGSFTVTFRDAGHILGSASIEVEDTHTKKIVVFSGDLGNTPEDIVKPTQFIERADVVVMETTYGSSDHPREDVSAILAEEIQAVEASGGVLMIPAFSIERTQELLHRIHHLKKEKKVSADIPVFMDSPMAQRATIIFKDFPQFYNDELTAHKDDPFGFEGLVVTQDSRDSKEIIRAMSPKVIIAGSGMLSGGRILGHAANYLSLPTTRLLFVGYQAEETLGRRILNGATSVNINDQRIKVKAKIREIKSLSSHADQRKLLDWVSHIQGVKKVFLIHGETSQRNAFYEKLKHELHIPEVYMPLLHQTYEI